jgi:hypothetical protein
MQLKREKIADMNKMNVVQQAKNILIACLPVLLVLYAMVGYILICYAGQDYALLCCAVCCARFIL